MKYFFINFFIITNSFAMTVVAHRGASGYLPEHTLEGASMAHAFNVDFIEPDIVVTKDDKLVILHDHHLDTTTNVKEIYPKRKRSDGRYYAVDFTLKEIKKLKVEERFNWSTGQRVYPNRFSSTGIDYKVPTFREFIELVQGLNKTRNKKIGIIPELKKVEFHLKEGKDITKFVIRVLREYGYEENGQVVIQSFWPESLIRLKNEFKTKIPLLQLVAKNSWRETSFDYSLLYTSQGLKDVAKYAKIISYPLSDLFMRGPKLKPSKLVQTVKSTELLLYGYTHRREDLPSGTSENIFLNFLIKEVRLDGLFSDFADKVIRLQKEIN